MNGSRTRIDGIVRNDFSPQARLAAELAKKLKAVGKAKPAKATAPAKPDQKASLPSEDELIKRYAGVMGDPEVYEAYKAGKGKTRVVEGQKQIQIKTKKSGPAWYVVSN